MVDQGYRIYKINKHCLKRFSMKSQIGKVVVRLTNLLGSSAKSSSVRIGPSILGSRVSLTLMEGAIQPNRGPSREGSLNTKGASAFGSKCCSLGRVDFA